MMFIMTKRTQKKPDPMRIGKETFGQRLARIRKEKGYTQVELADKMGIIQAYLSRKKGFWLHLGLVDVSSMIH